MAQRRKKRKLKKKYVRRRILAGALLIFILLSICYIFDLILRDEEYKLVGNDNEKSSESSATPSVLPSKSPSKTPGKTQVVTGNAASNSTTSKPSETSKVLKDVKFTASLYFPDENLNNLMKETVTLTYRGEVEKNDDIPLKDKIKIVIEALAKGPEVKPERNVFPKGTKVLGTSVINNMVEINFSQEFITNQANGSLPVQLTLGQIVLTCSEFGFDEVQLKIDNKMIDSYPGGVDLTKPLRKADYLNLKF